MGDPGKKIKYEAVKEVVISTIKEFREVDNIFSEYEHKICNQIDEKVTNAVDMMQKNGKKMKEEARKHLKKKKEEIESTADISNKEYLGISFEGENLTDNKIIKILGTIFPCAELKITEEQRDEFKKLPVPIPYDIADGYQIVHDFNYEELTNNCYLLSLKKENDRCSWRFKVKKKNKCLSFKPIITNLKPEKNLIIHFRIYLIWNNKPQRYLQMVHTITEDEPSYQELLDLEQLTDNPDQFKIRCIIKIVASDFFIYPKEGKELTEEEKINYNQTVNPKQVEHGFTCEELNEDKVIESPTITTDLGFSWGFQVKKSNNYLCVKPDINKHTKFNAAAKFKLIIYFKFYLIWKDEPQYYLEMERTNPAFQNLIFWDELTENTDAHAPDAHAPDAHAPHAPDAHAPHAPHAPDAQAPDAPHAPDAPDANTGQFKIRCVLQNADERVPLTPEK